MRKYTLMAVVAAFFAIPLAAQDPGTDPPNASASLGGGAAGGSYALSQIESVNPINGNMSLRIPAAHLPPGPGGFSAGVDLIYNSTIFDVQTLVPNNSVLQTNYVPSAHGGGWQYSYKYTLWSQTRISAFSPSPCGAINQTEAANWYKTVFATPDGANRVLRLVGALDQYGNNSTATLSSDATQSYDIYDFAGYLNANCGSSQAQFLGTLIYVTADSTYIRVEANTVTQKWVAYFPDGTQASGPINVPGGHAVDSDATLVTDRNGNTLGITGSCEIGSACTETLTDGQGRSLTVVYASNSSGTWTDTITNPNGPPTSPGGSDANLTTNVNWTSAALFGVPYYCEVSPNGATYTGSGGTCNLSNTPLPSVVASVQLPAAEAGSSLLASSNNGESTNFVMEYGPWTSPAISWGELHTLELCVGPAPPPPQGNCQPEWTEQYVYQFDTIPSLQGPNPTPTSQRPPGTITNPIASKTVSYMETLMGTSTPLQETTQYYIPVPVNVYTYPTVTSNPSSETNPSISYGEVLYPDGSYSEIYTENLCPAGLKARDLCVSLPYEVLNRDGSETQMLWTSNTPGPGIPSGAPFNPYVQYSVSTPANSSVSRIRYVQQDQNGNTTTANEYDWAPSSVVSVNSGTQIIASVCAAGGCPLMRQTQTTMYSQGDSYWLHGNPTYLRAPLTSTLYNGSGSAYTTTTYTFDNALSTANLTQLSQTDAPPTGGSGTPVNTHWTYLTNGNVASTTDPNNNVTLINYACGANGNSLYPSSVSVANILTTIYNYDCSSGYLNYTTDTNHITTTNTYDSLGRTVHVNQANTTSSPNLARTADVMYSDPGLAVTTQQDDTASGRLINSTNYDAMGRVQSTRDGLGRQVMKAYRYGTGGVSYQLTSNPYASTSDPTMGWTLTTQNLGTPTVVPNTISGTAYSGATLPGVWGLSSPNSNASGTTKTTANVIVSLPGCGGIATTTTDAAMNTRTNCVDGLGRLSAVLEPTGVLTSYTYDLLDNLTGVSAQCLSGSGYSCTPVGSTGQTRTFVYSTLSRLLSASNPESGTATYTNDAAGNVKTRTDANSTVTTVTGYDGLNRPLGVTYSPGTITLSSGATYSVAATPTVTYNYDNNSLGTGFTGFVGAPSSVSSSAGSMQYSYDGFGRVVQSRQTTPLGGQAYPFSNYSYSMTDQLTGMTYPSGRAVTYTLDAADEVTGASGAFAGGTTPYASGIQYMAAGGVTSLPMANGIITESRTWNNLMEQTSVSVASASAGNLLTLGYNYCQNLATNSVCGTTNTGSPFQHTIGSGGQTQAVQQFAPDGVNRITSASEQQGSSTAWSRQYSYDNLGNMTQTPTPGGATWTAGSFNSKNQVADANWVYDNAGNVVGAGTGGPTLQYDGESRLVKACGSSSCATFSYDAAGNRVQRTDSSSQSTTTTTFVYDAFGNLAADYGAPAGATTGTQYVAVDAMGSTRLVMDGTAVERHDFEPYGAELSGGWRTPALGYGSATLRQRFTGQERDDETTLDYFLARYYSGTQGRFGSPDPGNAGANPGDPQSWNGYAYVSGNPLTYTDPSGLLAQAGGGGDSGSGWGGAIVAGFELLGEGLADLFGGSSHPDLSKVAYTPMPTWSVTSWGSSPVGTVSSSTGDLTWMSPGVEIIPGLVFFAQGTAHAPTSARTCPAVPTSPAGVSLASNIHLAERSVSKIWAYPRLKWFYNQVKNKGPWDYKPVLLRAAGWAQVKAGTSTPQWGHWYDLNGPFGDDPADQLQIQRGITYYNTGCR